MSTLSDAVQDAITPRAYTDADCEEPRTPGLWVSRGQCTRCPTPAVDAETRVLLIDTTPKQGLLFVCPLCNARWTMYAHPAGPIWTLWKGAPTRWVRVNNGGEEDTTPHD